MKALIEKLARQAFDSGLDTDPILYYEVEKFAELIIRECINVVDAYDRKTDPDDIIVDIKEHFGVDQ